MELREYLFRKRMKIKQLAQELNYTSDYMSKIVLGKHYPSKKLCKLILQVTEGMVSEKDLLQTYEEYQEEIALRNKGK